MDKWPVGVASRGWFWYAWEIFVQRNCPLSSRLCSLNDLGPRQWLWRHRV